MNNILQNVKVVSISLLTLTFVLTPTLSFAASTKTYTFSNLSPYTTTGTTTWYSPQWKYRQKITINKESIGEDLTDFPVVIRFSDTDIYSHAKSDGTDILFTSSDGVTKLSHELEGNTNAWVKIPKLTPLNDTELYLYYGNPSAEDQQNVSDVWTNGYGAVYHLNNNPEGQIADSTGNDNNGTTFGGMEKGSALQDGKVGQALRFDGSNDGVLVGHSGSLTAGTEVTLSAFVKSDSSGWALPGGDHWNTIIRKAGNYIYRVKGNTSQLQMAWYDGVNLRRYHTPVNSVPANTWLHIVAVVENNDISTVYINGTEYEATPNTWFASGRSVDSLHIGNCQACTEAMKGRIDQAAVSTVARSGGWIKTEYKNQVGTEDFLTISDTVETLPSTAPESSVSTITLKPTHALSFTNLLSFKPNTQPTTTFTLSNDAGTTWYFYTTQGWKQANPNNPLHRSSINDISSHLDTFPQGIGKLTFKAYLQPGSTLDSLSIGYTKGTSTNTASFPQTIIALNSLYRQAYNQDPSFLQWTYWAKRMLVEKKTQQEWLGAMMWAAAR